MKTVKTAPVQEEPKQSVLSRVPEYPWVTSVQITPGGYELMVEKNDYDVLLNVAEQLQAELAAAKAELAIEREERRFYKRQLTLTQFANEIKDCQSHNGGKDE